MNNGNERKERSERHERSGHPVGGSGAVRLPHVTVARTLRPWIRGLVVAAAPMLLFALATGFFMALALLVFAMEEGGASMSMYAFPLAKALVLLAQGVSFHAAGIVVGIVPLSLTFLLILLVRTFTARLCAKPQAWVSGTVLWVAMSLLCTRGLTVGLYDDGWIVALKSALVFTIGFLWGSLPSSALRLRAVGYLHSHVSEPVRHTVLSGLFLGVLLLGIYALVGLGTLVAWIVLDHGAVGTLFDLLGVKTWSRVLIVVMSLAWLPNLVAWALSWLFGAGFSIGSLASFTLWSGSGSDLPSLPVFGLFPAAVDSLAVINVVMTIPLVVSAVVAVVALLWRRGFPIRLRGRDQDPDPKTMLVSFAYPAGAFCIAAVVVSLLSSLMFLLSNGSLGEGRLKDVGVDVLASTQAVARPTAMGLFGAWLAALVVTAAVFAVRWALASRRAAASNAAPVAAGDAGETTRKNRTVSNRKTGNDSSATVETAASPRRPRMAKSDRAIKSDPAKPNDHTGGENKAPRRVNSTRNAKENQGDHEPTTTTGTGIDLS
ncbi:cell division protein PerM [Bifidobacterium choloepi]|uniref:Permease n=1 Tax=Bifidobacterium choloepi TaxID=2614131 RepID=A0A6I5NFH5_9BIFI|nr:DUF6350 family protein [Bifidobacterium choloepi]NEG69113.1 permease [Bifidobacterium choloepi]